MNQARGKLGRKGAIAAWVIMLVVAAMIGTNFWFQSTADGSFLMYRAAQIGLVSDTWAKGHLLDIVYFKRLPDGSWEYRVPRPLLGDALVPGIVAKRTTKDLGALCETPDANGNKGCMLVSLVGRR